MPKDYPLRFSSQMRQHLRALRKKHGLTQAQLGALVGVSQARIAEIEANPGLVNLDQMLQLLAALGTTLALEEDTAASSASLTETAKDKLRKTQETARAAEPPTATLEKNAKPTAQTPFLARPKKGSW